MTVLLKECRDIQLRCGSFGLDGLDDGTIVVATDAVSDTEKVISERLVSFLLVFLQHDSLHVCFYAVEVIDV